jgi:hypothetical protein
MHLVVDNEAYYEGLISDCEAKMNELPMLSPIRIEYALALNFYEWKLNRIRNSAEE